MKSVIIKDKVRHYNTPYNLYESHTKYIGT